MLALFHSLFIFQKHSINRTFKDLSKFFQVLKNKKDRNYLGLKYNIIYYFKLLYITLKNLYFISQKIYYFLIISSTFSSNKTVLFTISFALSRQYK